jgi:hypothetical protein
MLSKKSGGILPERNNGIIGVDFLNRTCAFGPHFESMLGRESPIIFFRQHRSQAAFPIALAPRPL